MPNNEIQALIANFTNDLQTLMRRNALEEVVAMLQGQAGPARRGPGRPKGSTNKPAGKRGRRSAADMAGLGEKLLAHVRANPGQRGEQIAAALGSDVGTIRPVMHKLIAARQVKTQGQRRGMTYHPAGGGAAPKAPAKGKGGKKAA